MNRIFNDPHHEWLRVALSVNSNSDILYELEAEASEPERWWNDMLHLGVLHQADGVVTWRSGQRQDYQQWLRERRDRFMGVAGNTWKKLEHLQVYLHGFPLPYLTLGMAPEWGRYNDNVNFIVPPSDYRKAKWLTDTPMVDGVEVHVSVRPLYSSLKMYDHLEYRDVYGIPMRTVRPELGIILRARSCYSRFSFPSFLPLMDLADIANQIVTSFTFDWSLTWQFIDQVVMSDELAEILWVWVLADNVYQCFPPKQRLEIVKRLPVSPPKIITREGTYAWDTWPGDEKFLFTKWGRYSDKARVADGIWKEVCHAVPTD